GVDGCRFTGWDSGNRRNGGWNGGWGDKNGGDDYGSYQILQARYGTARSNVDVTERLRELAREDIAFRMGNSTFGVDPDRGVLKKIRREACRERGEILVVAVSVGSTVGAAL